MPEGPSIIIFKEEVKHFEGKKVLAAGGNLKAFDPQIMVGKKLLEVKTFGKQMLLCFKGFAVRAHFLMFGSYGVDDDPTGRKVRLGITFTNGTLNFYATAIKLIEEPLDEVYDWSADVMNEAWDADKALAKLKEIPETIVADALLDQHIFSGVGNIIKNEVLFRIKLHPKSLVGKVPKAKLKEMIKEAVNYSFDFLEWKKAYQLKKHYLVYTKKVCPRDKTPVKKEYLGKTKRRTFFCDTCQKLHK